MRSSASSVIANLRILCAAFVFGFIFLLVSSSQATMVGLKSVASGFSLPTSIFTAGDRYYISTKTGKVWMAKENDTQSDLVLALQIPASKLKFNSPENLVAADPVEGNWGGTELGLCCVVVTEGLMYVSYTAKQGVYGMTTSGSGIIEEYTLLPDGTADESSARLILALPRPEQSLYETAGYTFTEKLTLPPVYDATHLGSDPGIHNSLTMVLWTPPEGPDAGRTHLLIGSGDAGTYCDRGGLSQDLTSPWGKILQIIPRTDIGGPTYDVPLMNPFAGDADPVKELILAYGLRNPWSIYLDEQNLQLFIGDVGQGRIEEVDAFTLGVTIPNFGWPIKEGDECLDATDDQYWTPLATCDDPSGYVPPIHTYQHGWLSAQSGGPDNGIAIIGVKAYHGSEFPTLQDKLIIGDLNSVMAVLNQDGQSRIEFTRVFAASTDKKISCMGVDANGEILVGDAFPGTLYRLISGPLAVPPASWQSYTRE